ncbi:TPA: potassium-transporting ATPase subunit B [Listeria monocytogenes]|nr:potassium-transporting ATPase subunit B [Listeria monocytogenes]HAK1512284.1 potassium-transporting ATPase subunit B [Listeria monocytogenes]
MMEKGIWKDALIQSTKKLSPKLQVKNPVMLLVYVGAILATSLYFLGFFGISDEKSGYTLAIALILWFTVLFANFAEAIAEGRGRAQADSLKMARKDVLARKLKNVDDKTDVIEVASNDLKKGDIVYVLANEQIPMDGEVIEGAASVDESAITGESAPVIRESGGDRSAVTGGTTLVSDWLVVRVTAVSGESFLDKMIAMVEGASRKKTPNEIALQILLVTLSIIFLAVSATLLPFTEFASKQAGAGSAISITNVIALLVCLAPTTIGALLSSIGIAGMSRLNQANVLAMSGRAIEAAGDVDVLLLDKTGTITLGNRKASEFLPVDGVTEQELADAVRAYVTANGGTYPKECDAIVSKVAGAGGTPLVVVRNNQVLGVIYLKDIVKNGVKERFLDLRKMGIKTIMITGDNPMTAAAIAAEAGVDDFLAEATPEAKLELIREYQREGHLVAMTGDGTNDAPALAQADVAVAMNTGTQAAKEAGNMVDLDSSPTKLIDIVRIGKQLLMTRGALTTFSVANDLAKYFAIIPVLFYGIFPQLEALNLMGLTSPTSAILSAIIYNAVIIIVLIPLSLKGVKYREMPAGKLLSRNMLIYGLGGLIAPFIAIKLIDMLLTVLGIV